MNTIISNAKNIVELCKQSRRDRDQILPSTALDKIEIKALKLIQDAEGLRAFLCASCEKVGMPDSNDLTVNLETAKDE